MKTAEFYSELLCKLNSEGSVQVSTDLSTGEKSFGFTAIPHGLHEEISLKPRIFLCGGGHVSAALAPLLHQLDWQLSVQDDRPEFVTEERFPLAEERICAPFETLAERRFPAGTYFVVMTRGHQDDFLCLSSILRSNAAYIGMIGSRSKVAKTAERLRAQGFSEEAIASVHSPVGLPIGAQTPMEIAVSIAAEIISVFRQTPCNYLERHIVDGLLQRSEPLVLATVLEKSGSSPRGEGTRMLVRRDSSAIGTVGGGAVEAAVLREAAALCGSEKSLVRSYDLSNAKAATLGMICGGSIRVLFEPLN